MQRARSPRGSLIRGYTGDFSPASSISCCRGPGCPAPQIPTDLTDAQSALLEPMVPRAKFAGRPRKHEVRDILDAIRYVLRGGVAWHALSHEYPTWQTVYGYFRNWQQDGTWERFNDELRDLVRQHSGRSLRPTAVILASH
ncbi:MAG: transposase [Thermomicrobiales bacterium]